MDLDGKFKENRKQRNLFSYQDLLTMMLQLLSFGPYRNEIKSRLKYLFVDEYQDVDELQRKIFHLLTSSEGSKRVFFTRVGDPNQSIYSFRGAQHDKFLREESMSRSSEMIESVTLEVNMRSHSKVLSFINWLFGSETNTHGIENHLFQKLKSYIKLYGKEDQLSDSNKAGVFIPIISGSDNDEKNTKGSVSKKVKKDAAYYRSLEAECISQMIKENKVRGEDPKTAILFRTWGNVSIYTRALRNHSLSYNIIGKGESRESHLLKPVLYILKLILDPNDRTSLVGILRSPLVGLKDADVEQFILSPKLKIIDPFKKPRIDDKMSDSKPLKHFLEKLLFLYHERLNHTLEEFIHLLFNSFNMTEMINLKEEHTSNIIMQIFQNVREIESTALTLNQDELLKRLIDSIELIFEENGSLFESGGTAIDQSADVQLMSIHSSKGLEFDTVFMADTIYDLDTPTRTSEFFIESGSENGDHETILFSIKGDISFVDTRKGSPRQRQEQIEEEESARLLYVALTRAKERIYFPLIPEWQKKNSASYQNWMVEFFLSRASLELLDHEGGSVTFPNGPKVFIEPRKIKLSNEKPMAKERKELKIEKAGRNEMFSYHFISASSLLEEKKLSPIKKDHSKRPAYQEISPQQKGNLVHKVFEWLDFDSLEWNEEDRRALMRSFNLPDSVLAIATTLIDDTLSKFKNSELFTLIQRGIVKGREVPFSSFYSESKKENLSHDLKKEIAIGYLDLLLYLPKGFATSKREFGPGLYLIDYKTNEKSSKMSDRDFQIDLLKEYRTSIKLYQNVLQDYYRNSSVEPCLYHTGSGELLFYEQPPVNFL